ncbi:tail fiber protein [Ottowia sp.]|uniref:phage tail protein n=1 Tax=Ottowia sp. TaxID=1898956 RepID=UPI002D1147B7|nr:tail fiber protein [Ottowia sp.]HPR45587.1 tail fiber protein [Ottowia sp.]HRW72648.1 tail fiber protein [Ottowia sp.]
MQARQDMFSGRRSGRLQHPARQAIVGLLLAAAGVPMAYGQATEPFLGQLALLPYTFCPRGWTEANGQLVAISSNTALFSLLGTTYGGDGRTNFALPDLRGRVPLGQGQGPGLSSIQLGEQSGAESVTLMTNQMPMHTHALQVSSQAATHAAPANTRVLAATQNAGSYVAAAPDTTLAAGSVGVSGGGQPFSVRNPYLGMRWCIALQGIFPSRN